MHGQRPKGGFDIRIGPRFVDMAMNEADVLVDPLRHSAHERAGRISRHVKT